MLVIVFTIVIPDADVVVVVTIVTASVIVVVAVAVAIVVASVNVVVADAIVGGVTEWKPQQITISYQSKRDSVEIFLR